MTFKSTRHFYNKNQYDWFIKYLRKRKAFSYNKTNLLVSSCEPFYTFDWGERDIIKFLESLDLELSFEDIIESIKTKQKELLYNNPSVLKEVRDTKIQQNKIPFSTTRDLPYSTSICLDLKKRLYRIWFKNVAGEDIENEV